MARDALHRRYGRYPRRRGPRGLTRRRVVVAEIAALAVPSILVPYPLATADHQTTNARLLTDAGAAVKFSDDDIDGDAFRDELLGLLGDAPRRASMREAARGLAQDKAAAMLADLLEGIA